MGNLSTGSGGNSYYDYARRQQVFSAYATVTSMGAYSTAAGTGGPLLWNNTGSGAGKGTRVLAALLAVGAGMSVASAAAGTIGVTGNSGQTSAPGSTTAIDAVANTFIGAAGPLCNVYRIGTPSNAGNFFQPLGLVGTGAVTVDDMDFLWWDLGGSIVVPPGSWASVAASAVLTTGVIQVGLMWAEIPFP